MPGDWRFNEQIKHGRRHTHDDIMGNLRKKDKTNDKGESDIYERRNRVSSIVVSSLFGLIALVIILMIIFW